MPIALRSQPLVLFFLSLSLALFTACASDERSDAPGGATAEIPDYPPALVGTENFADGTVGVRVTLGLPSKFTPDKPGEHRHGSGRSHGGERHGGMGAGGPPRGDEGSSNGATNDDRPAPVAMGSNLPPAQLKLYLQNNSATDSLSCEVVDFNSSLGNFAVFPSRFQVAPGQTASSEIMTSRLGVEGSEIAVTVGIRILNHLEKKIITLRKLPKPTEPAGADTAK